MRGLSSQKITSFVTTTAGFAAMAGKNICLSVETTLTTKSLVSAVCAVMVYTSQTSGSRRRRLKYCCDDLKPADWNYCPYLIVVVKLKILQKMMSQG